MPGPAREVRTHWLTGASYGGMFVFGIVMAVIGALLPRLTIGLAQAGNLLLGLTCSMLVAQLCLGPVMDRFGKKLPLAFGSLFVAAALAVMAVSRSYESLLIAVVLLGSGGGALNGGTNTLIADLHADPRRKNAALNALGVFFGFGALFLPFVLGTLVEQLGLNTILWLSAAPTAIISLLFFVLGFPEPKRAEGVPLSEMARFVRNPLVLLFGFLLFFQSGNEFLVNGYTSVYLVRELHLSLGAASYVLAGYWAALMIARMVLSRLLLRVSGPGVVIASGLLVVAGSLLMFAAPGAVVGTAGVILISIGFASIYPTVLGMAGAEFEQASGTVFGILFAIALCGGMLVPWSAAQLGAQTSLRGIPLIAAFGGLMIAALQWRIAKHLTKP